MEKIILLKDHKKLLSLETISISTTPCEGMATSTPQSEKKYGDSDDHTKIMKTAIILCRNYKSSVLQIGNKKTTLFTNCKILKKP